MTDTTRKLPDEVMVWHSHERLDHLGSWATTRYPEEAVAYVPLADAQAAVALVVAELRQFVTDSYQCGCMDAGCAGRHAERNSTLEALSETLDALAPIDGLALVRELRAERDAADQRAGAMLARIVALEADGEAARSAASTNFARAETAEADRDRLAAANAVLEAKVAGLREAVD